MKIIFMGTPDFSAGILKALKEEGHDIVLAVTQPDKPKGRSGRPVYSDVKEYALSQGIEVFQPEKIKDESALSFLRGKDADIFVVAAFGQILSKEILDMPKYGCINVHASLLPKYRGASPIQQAIIDGEKITGVTIMQMDEGLDTGDILFSLEVPIDAKETGGSLFEKLEKAGAKLIITAVKKIEKGEVRPLKQDEDKASYSGRIKKSLGRIDFTDDAKRTERLIRALDPWPSAYTQFDGKTLKIWKADVSGDDITDGRAGLITRVGKDTFTVECKSGALEVKEVQLEGKKRMSVRDFLLGCKLSEGMHIG